MARCTAEFRDPLMIEFAADIEVAAPPERVWRILIGLTQEPR
jgi:hypothetical protein